MKDPIRKHLFPILFKLLPFFEGVLTGIVIGMAFALCFVSKEDRKVFPPQFYLVAMAIGLLAALSIPLSDFLQRKISEWRSR